MVCQDSLALRAGTANSSAQIISLSYWLFETGNNLPSYPFNQHIFAPMTPLYRFWQIIIVFSISMVCQGETALGFNIGSTNSTIWKGHLFKGVACPIATACKMLPSVQGADEPQIFQSYSEGNITVSLPVPNGTYDITLFFAEPRAVAVGERVFDVMIQGEPVLRAVDVVKYRDGQAHAALTVTLPKQVIRNEPLNLTLMPSTGLPILSGLLLEPLTESPRSDSPWQLVWQDLFDESRLNPAHWSVDVWPPGKVNNEDQAYTGSPRNLRIENGALVLEAHHHPGSAVAFTSARIHTRGKHDFLYGRVEVVARLPNAQGTWPAIWLLPSDPFTYASNCAEGTDWQGNPDCDAWPNSGEIDLMEHVGFEAGHIHGTVHTRANYWVNGQQRKGRLIQPTATSNFHQYAMEWRPERIDLFVDDSLYFSYLREADATWKTWPFDQPFHLILNLAVGGNWGRAGGPIAEQEFPQRLLIDSVKLYQLAQ